MTEPSPYELLAFGTTPVGTVYPPQPPRPLPDKDPREYALERLKEYLARLRFRRTMATGELPRGFRVPRERIHLFWPDSPVQVRTPSIAFVPGRGTHDYLGLGVPVICSNSADVYGPGTVLVYQSDYVETFTIEVAAAKHAVRRAVMAGIKVALRIGDTSTVVSFNLPDYYNVVARFSLDESEVADNPDAVKNRRIGQLFVEMRVPEVFLVDYTQLQVVVDLGGLDATRVWDGNLFADLDGTPFAFLDH